jgi:hypothetical protein
LTSSSVPLETKNRIHVSPGVSKDAVRVSRSFPTQLARHNAPISYSGQPPILDNLLKSHKQLATGNRQLLSFQYFEI